MMPSEDGWRTPMIEDLEHRANRQGGAGFPFADRIGSLETTKEEDGKADEEGGLPGESPKKLSWPQRMKHVTWAWFTITMATGGIANVLHSGIVLLTYSLVASNV
jgi:hypothetical protein